jgi:hypothetical protein
MQKLISLFAEALEIMNIKAKLNVSLSFFRKNTILFSQQAILARLFNDSVENSRIEMKISLEQNEIICHSRKVVFPSFCRIGV